jgi:multidrug efflux pump subunit AcrA (membrane-fusion protein)
VWAGLVVVGTVAAALFAEHWWPPLRERIAVLVASPNSTESAAPEGSDAHHEHDDHAHSDPNSLELSEQARKNIGLKVGEVRLTEFERHLSIPGMVVERPGKSRLEVTAPFTGMVAEIHATQGEAVRPGQELFELRLTHEDIVQAQSELLRTAEELKVIRREVDRLKAATQDGAIARKSLLERQYEEQKHEAAFRAQREALRLHGLDDRQIATILEHSTLLPSFTVAAPSRASMMGDNGGIVLQIQDLKAVRGQHVVTGDVLAVLVNHAELLIEGRAFEQDAALVAAALEKGWKVNAVVESHDPAPTKIENLELLYVANRVDPESRALHFYVRLKNAIARDSTVDDERFVVWRFKPGQRMQILVPVEKWEKKMVLPIDAIAQDGVETYVFRENGKHFVRQPVQVVFRDPFNAVVASDGSLYPGDPIAMNAAHQLLVALKNKSGGGVDPHAGHSH